MWRHAHLRHGADKRVCGHRLSETYVCVLLWDPSTQTLPWFWNTRAESVWLSTGPQRQPVSDSRATLQQAFISLELGGHCYVRVGGWRGGGSRPIVFILIWSTNLLVISVDSASGGGTQRACTPVGARPAPSSEWVRSQLRRECVKCIVQGLIFQEGSAHSRFFHHHVLDHSLCRCCP